MNRPLYESLDNLANEEEVAEACARVWQVQVVKLKPLYRVDRATVFDGEVTGLLEIKCRQHVAGTYADYMISLDKLVGLLEFSSLTGLSVLLVVRFTDRTLWHQVTRDAARAYWYGMGGRTDRNDLQDTEPVGYIPLKLFQAL